MKLSEMDNKIDAMIDNINSTEDLKTVLKTLVDYTTMLGKTLEDTLSNLNSDNVTEINFGITRLSKPINLINKMTTEALGNNGAATKQWVISNFQPKT